MTNPDQTDRLWVPALCHYRRDGGRVALDSQRTAAHLRAMQPAVRQFLLAGSTGDGWEMAMDELEALLRLTTDAATFGDTRFLVGILRPTTEEVVERARQVERLLEGLKGRAGQFVGFAVCPPIDAKASQPDIRAHYEAVLAATSCPIAAYQLPQITHCRIEAETLRELAANPRLGMFKDTSGEDTVAKAGRIQGVTFVRGAEGGYLEALGPSGPYDGWLLSTGNVFGRLLRTLLDLHARGEALTAQRLSNVMSELVAGLFAAAAELPFGNPFSNANRAADHLAAHGDAWRDQPLPLTISGNELPTSLLQAAFTLLGHLPRAGGQGYLRA
ncbi:Dihydrodipicolinate synthase/N-acetylneuraminate lyase [Arboricoccus pini]|uniref:Dihydrodipicolinate synthase/N-acetylneuraminate lyase n=1 Tax=Arboricoccus pini TaxID=1963835 RepID=A0A212RUH2_9PROT|nr:dihydrodipicolinate synthase family protein [Arboricoccus pini]SNB76355.1 Dihydrodipicolinate synthase/N-acetylneuraminate lyase [Arboricoccus pini]